MGKNHSAPAAPFNAPKPRRSLPKHEASHNLRILTDVEDILIRNLDFSMTCGWLLSEAIREYQGEKTLVALKTRSNLDIIDEWLLRFEKSLKPLREVHELVAIFADDAFDGESDSFHSIKNFKVLKLLGIGSSSHVYLCRKKDTGILYAVKVVGKAEVLANSRLEKVISERMILSQISSCFIVKLHWAFQSVRFRQDSNLFFVFGFCPGGELAFHLKNIGRLTENQGKFYFAEIFTAIEYLHKNNVIFNNLKAENIMLDIDGHIKLVDFSKASARLWEDSITFTLGAARDVGFDELQEEKSRDYLDIGCFLYELLTTCKPDLSKITFPKYLSESCVSLLALLLSQPSKVTFEDIKNHIWCQGIDWQKISRKRGTPPLRPNFKRSNFPHFDMKNINIVDSSYEEYIRGFDFMTKEIEKCFSNIGEMVLESNVTSERNSTDAEDTFNTLASLRSFNNSSRLDNLDGSQSFLMQRNVTKDERKSSFKSVSPVERNSRFFSLKKYFGEVSGLKRLFKEDMPRAENLNELIQSDGKMKEVLRKKIVNIK